jgi:hypothetical protein
MEEEGPTLARRRRRRRRLMMLRAAKQIEEEGVDEDEMAGDMEARGS